MAFDMRLIKIYLTLFSSVRNYSGMFDERSISILIFFNFAYKVKIKAISFTIYLGLNFWKVNLSFPASS
jgi:hypothetical protein